MDAESHEVLISLKPQIEDLHQTGYLLTDLRVEGFF